MLEALLAVHIIICIALVGAILLQRSEGGGALGIGGGPSGLMSSRSAANFMTRTTGILATLFFLTSISLVVASGGVKKPASSVMGQGRDANGLPTKAIEFGNSTTNATNNVANTTGSNIPQSQAAPTAPQNSVGSEFSTSTIAPAAQNEQKTDKNSK